MKRFAVPLLFAAGCAAPPTPGPTLTPQDAAAYATPAAMTASELRDSFGVAVHIPYNDTTYHDTARVLAYLQDLGVVRIRDGMKKAPGQFQTDFFGAAAAAGLKTTLVVGDPAGRDGQFGAGDAALAVAALTDPDRYGGKVAQLEGPNEWDLTGGGWQTELRDFYAEYRAAVRAEPRLDGVPFYGGAMAYGTNFQSYVDRNQEGAVLHPYPGGELPEGAFITRQLGYARNSAGAGKPVIATELGYNNAVNSVGTGNVGVPEDIDAHYLVREVVYNRLIGIAQSYRYQLFDEKPGDADRTSIEAWFGLVAVENPRGSADKKDWTLRKKPAFVAMDNMLAYLVDTGTRTAPATLPVRVSAPANAVVVPIARKDGSFDVAVWLKNELYRVAGTMNTPGARVRVPDTAATVTLDFDRVSDVDAFRPSVSATATDLGPDAASVTATVDGKVTYFRVR